MGGLAPRGTGTGTTQQCREARKGRPGSPPTLRNLNPAGATALTKGSLSGPGQEMPAWDVRKTGLITQNVNSNTGQSSHAAAALAVGFHLQGHTALTVSPFSTAATEEGSLAALATRAALCWVSSHLCCLPWRPPAPRGCYALEARLGPPCFHCKFKHILTSWWHPGGCRTGL